MEHRLHLFFFNKINFSIFDDLLALTYYTDENLFLNDFFLPRAKDFLYPFLRSIEMKEKIKLSSSSYELIYSNSFRFEDIIYDDYGQYESGNSRRVIIEQYKDIICKLEGILKGETTVEEFNSKFNSDYNFLPRLTYSLTVDEECYYFYGLVNILFYLNCSDLELSQFVNDVKILANGLPCFVTHLGVIEDGDPLRFHDFIYVC